MNMGMGNFSYTISRKIPESWSGLINFIFNRLVRKLRPQKNTNLQALIDQPIYQMMMLVTEKESKNLALQFPELSFTRSSPYATDIISKGMSKLKGIEKVGEIYGFGLDEVMVFGDSNNDIEMLAGTKHSVAMGNASRKARKVASYVTESNNKDGIYKAIKHFGLMGEEDVSE